jgi:hypothetical protein
MVPLNLALKGQLQHHHWATEISLLAPCTCSVVNSCLPMSFFHRNSASQGRSLSQSHAAQQAASWPCRISADDDGADRSHMLWSENTATASPAMPPIRAILRCTGHDKSSAGEPLPCPRAQLRRKVSSCAPQDNWQPSTALV